MIVNLKRGDRVIVAVPNRQSFRGEITGEGREGEWWLVRKDGTKFPNGYHKDYCRPEVENRPDAAAE
jgi:hypothetical protein